jgi:colanic acid/amylovoran biosynthesis glycosyltransferase
MKIGYLMNQHPYSSCTFIRREIVGLEAAGLTVSRFSIRPPEMELKDEADKEEYQKTRFILGGIARALQLLGACLQVAYSQPSAFFKALQLTLKIGRRSERGVLVNLIYLLEACRLVQWLNQEAIEHVHAHFATNAAAVAMLAEVLGGPGYSFTVHGPHEFDKPEAIALTEKINRARFVVGVSSFGKSQLYRWCEYSQWSKIHVVHCGVDEIFLQSPTAPFPETPSFVCVGRLGEQKGHLLLVEAASKLAAAGYDFKLVFVGDGPLRSEIEAQLKQYQLQNQIQITGWASSTEVQQYVLSTQVMVLPSFAEGLPVVLMEALALGRPVISTYIAGIPELVTDGQSGWLVPAGSAAALSEALKKAIETPVAELQAMGKQGAAVVAEQHDARIEAGKLAELFQQYLPN